MISVRQMLHAAGCLIKANKLYFVVSILITLVILTLLVLLLGPTEMTPFVYDLN